MNFKQLAQIQLDSEVPVFVDHTLLSWLCVFMFYNLIMFPQDYFSDVVVSVQRLVFCPVDGNRYQMFKRNV